MQGWQWTRISDKLEPADLNLVAERIVDTLKQRRGEPQPQVSESEAKVAAELELLLGSEGRLISVPLEEFERRRHEALRRLDNTPLWAAVTGTYLASDSPVRRLLAYCTLQVYPAAESLQPLLDTWPRESRHARESGETRGLWNLLEALHQYRHRNTIPFDARSGVVDVAIEIKDFLEGNNNLDPGRQCRISVQCLLELLTPPV